MDDGPNKRLETSDLLNSVKSLENHYMQVSFCIWVCHGMSRNTFLKYSQGVLCNMNQKSEIIKLL